jgi:RING-box protein 1
MESSTGAGGEVYVPTCTLKKLNVVYMTSFAGEGMQQCAICRNQLMEASIEHQANPSADSSGLTVAKGCCGHGFHLDCIQRWLKSRSSCPLCNREWEIIDTFKISN